MGDHEAVHQWQSCRVKFGSSSLRPQKDSLETTCSGKSLPRVLRAEPSRCLARTREWSMEASRGRVDETAAMHSRCPASSSSAGRACSKAEIKNQFGASEVKALVDLAKAQNARTDGCVGWSCTERLVRSEGASWWRAERRIGASITGSVLPHNLDELPLVKTDGDLCVSVHCLPSLCAPSKFRICTADSSCALHLDSKVPSTLVFRRRQCACVASWRLCSRGSARAYDGSVIAIWVKVST